MNGSILDKVAQEENVVISQVEVVLEQAEVVMNQKDWLPGAEVKNDQVAKWSDKTDLAHTNPQYF